jgi:ribosomal protein S18 acetylase RimI-like enzyme
MQNMRRDGWIGGGHTMFDQTHALQVRDGVRRDAVPLTQVINSASEGLALAIWKDMASPGNDPWEIGAARAMRDEGAFSWRNARVCERDGEVAGALIGYRLTEEPEEVEPNTPPVFRPLIDLEKRVPGTFYVNALATLKKHRRTGVARALIEDAVGLVDGADLSLIVASANSGARAFYRTMAFREIAKAPVVTGFGWRSRSSDWILMRCGA